MRTFALSTEAEARARQAAADLLAKMPWHTATVHGYLLGAVKAHLSQTGPTSEEYLAEELRIVELLWVGRVIEVGS